MCATHSAHVTGVAEEMRVQREALRAGLIGELLAALLGEGKNKNTRIRTGMHTEGKAAQPFDDYITKFLERRQSGGNLCWRI